MRYLQLDFMRGIAIILMVVFHFCFDLNNFHFININIYNGTFWHLFRFIILTLFLLCVGISLTLANPYGVNFHKALKRFVILIVLASFISLASYLIFPKSWIYFGVLHFIACASLLALIFVRFSWFNLFLGTAILGLYFSDVINMHWLYNSLHEALHLPKYTEDLVSLFPWFGVVLIGMFIGKKGLYLFALKENKYTHVTAYLGKHSLLIYMLHQPLLFGLTAGANYLLH